MIDLDFISKTWKYLLAFYVLSVLLSPGLLLNIPPIERPISNGDKMEDKEGKENENETIWWLSGENTLLSSMVHSLLFTILLIGFFIIWDWMKSPSTFPQSTGRSSNRISRRNI